MTRLIKFCKEEYNVANGCDTLQLGTFQFYRELDPSFSIADGEEGFIQYHGPEEQITINAEQLNSITGGAMHITDASTAGQPSFQNPGGTHISLSGHTIIFEDGVMRAHLDGEIDIKVFYPNAYMFCMSILEDDDVPDPSSISNEYDSYYEIDPKTIGKFIEGVGTALSSQLALGDIKIDGFMEQPLANMRQPFAIQNTQGPVQYVPETEIRLNRPEDFTENRFYDIYQESMFKKNQSYLGDKEFRIVFFIRHPQYGFVSANPAPKILNMKPIKQCLI